MNTLVTDLPEKAAGYIRAGDIAAFPTETVYGLGADAFRPDAVQKIFNAKGRPSDNPLIVHIAELSQVNLVVSDLRPYAALLISEFFPGPLTIVVKKADCIPAVVTAGLDTIGFRMPRHPTALAFLHACSTPVAAPSANRSGRPSPTSWQAVLNDLDGRIPCILRDGRADIGLESTVVDCTGAAPVILRSGAVSLEELRRVVPGARPFESGEDGTPRSPGLRHRHYSPEANVVLVQAPPPDPAPRSAYIGLTIPDNPERFELRRICRNAQEYAFELFDFFRVCDAADLTIIYCEMPPGIGIGVALRDRLRRAADSRG